MNLFIANLNTSTTSRDLLKLFSHYGAVITTKIIYDRTTGLSKCYGFVDMPNSCEAYEALKELNNNVFQENLILVKESEPTGYRSVAANSGSPTKNRFIRSAGTFNHPQKIRSTADNVQNGNRRNYGYRGSGHRNF